MNCGECLERLYEFLDRELSDSELKTVRGHIDDCPGCADHFYFEERFLEKIRTSCEGERAPERLRETIILRLREG
jgi:mycothiol system anti-sigma-R factor